MPYFLLSLAACFWGGELCRRSFSGGACRPDYIIRRTLDTDGSSLIYALYQTDSRPVANDEKGERYDYISCAVRTGYVPTHAVYRPAIYFIS